MPVKCIFCDESFHGLDLLRAHSANCPEHPAVKEREAWKLVAMLAFHPPTASDAELRQVIQDLKVAAYPDETDRAAVLASAAAGYARLTDPTDRHAARLLAGAMGVELPEGKG